MMQTPSDVVRSWIEAFNRADPDALACLYDRDAINHQVVKEPVRGREAIRDMFESEFADATMVCQMENLFEDGEWAILEWKDPHGLRGCGFFQVERWLDSFSEGLLGPPRIPAPQRPPNSRLIGDRLIATRRKTSLRVAKADHRVWSGLHAAWRRTRVLSKQLDRQCLQIMGIAARRSRIPRYRGHEY
jgi:hypothetical protein